MTRRKRDGEGALGRPVAFRLPEAERAAWLDKVSRSGLTQSEFFRQAVLTNRTRVIARPAASAERRRLLYIFNQASHTLNQLASRANTGYTSGALSETTFEHLLTELQMISRYLASTLAKVE